MNKWLVIPGWATTTAIFDKILPEKLVVDKIDLNFDKDGDFPSSLTGDYYGIICYSLGTILALKMAAQLKIKKIIAIGGFSFFPGVDLREQKLRKIKINLMIKGLKVNPLKTLQDFYQEAGIDFEANKMTNITNLEYGLTILRDWDMTAEVLKNKFEIITIHGENDKIVPIEQMRLQLPDRQEFNLQGGHGIFQTHGHEIKNIIHEQVNGKI